MYSNISVSSHVFFLLLLPLTLFGATMIIQRKGIMPVVSMYYTKRNTFTPFLSKSTRTATSIASMHTKNTYEHLKESRPIRIYAKQIATSNSHKQALSPDSKLVHFQRHGQGKIISQRRAIKKFDCNDSNSVISLSTLSNLIRYTQRNIRQMD